MFGIQASTVFSHLRAGVETSLADCWQKNIQLCLAELEQQKLLIKIV